MPRVVEQRRIARDFGGVAGCLGMGVLRIGGRGWLRWRRTAGAEFAVCRARLRYQRFSAAGAPRRGRCTMGEGVDYRMAFPFDFFLEVSNL